ncbi:NFYC4 [Scenedesmus sp. PABB004]|nr:NFYC4 [Scenedesmus sp. PABB004]
MAERQGGQSSAAAAAAALYAPVLRPFWEQQKQEVSSVGRDPAEFKNHQLPLARIKKIMKSDEDVRMISAEAPVLFAKACEMFILELTLRGWVHSEDNRRRTLQRSDIAAAVAKNEIFDFLADVVPLDEATKAELAAAEAGGGRRRGGGGGDDDDDESSGDGTYAEAEGGAEAGLAAAAAAATPPAGDAAAVRAGPSSARLPGLSRQRGHGGSAPLLGQRWGGAAAFTAAQEAAPHAASAQALDGSRARRGGGDGDAAMPGAGAGP